MTTHMKLFATILALILCLTGLTRIQAREIRLLQDNWRFSSDDAPGAEQISTDDTGWQALSLPHNWGWEQAQRGDEKYPRGPGWYRRTLAVTPQPDRRYFVRFGAAGSVAEVYLNGTKLGQHRGAFGAFCFELTQALATNAPNVLAVRVSNAPEPDIAPLDGGFPVYGGLYRDVEFIETDDTCFTLADHASPGVVWQQTGVNSTQAILVVTMQVSNGRKQKVWRTVSADIFAAAGTKIASAQATVLLAAGNVEPVTLSMVVPKPHLWNGRLDPYLYRAVVTLRANDQELDAVEQKLGLRWFSVDPDHGFFLNGKPYPLHGVSRHQDRPDKGWAISRADQDEDLALLEELGATVVRCAHYQHSDYFYSLCDQAGVLVWAELPLVNCVSNTASFAETSRNQLLDLIRQNINHPSIFCWSLFNELRENRPDPHRLLQDLNQLAKGEDPTRLTVGATLTDQLPQMNRISDLLGWNRYPGWYEDYAALTNFSQELAGCRNSSRYGGFCLSEYGAGANIAQHEQNPPKPKFAGPWHPEEWQSRVHEETWRQLKSQPYIWATLVWNLADFVNPNQHEGGTDGLNDKGLVTFDRQTRKDAFFFYRANWNALPLLHITSQRDHERTNAITDVKIYSNARTVELFLNGKNRGLRTNDDNSVFIWKDCRLIPGDNLVEARAQMAGKEMQDSCVWKLFPSSSSAGDDFKHHPQQSSSHLPKGEIKPAG